MFSSAFECSLSKGYIRCNSKRCYVALDGDARTASLERSDVWVANAPLVQRAPYHTRGLGRGALHHVV